jgi:hypothetical protein
MRSVILIVVAGCALLVGAVRAQIVTETIACFPDNPTEYHHIVAQPTLSVSDGVFLPGATVSYMLTDPPNINGLTAGCDLQFGGSRRTTFFLDYTRSFTEYPVMIGAHATAGIGLGMWQEKLTPELRIGVGYAFRVRNIGMLMLTLGNRLGFGKHLSPQGSNSNAGAGIAFAYRIGQTYWRE